MSIPADGRDVVVACLLVPIGRKRNPTMGLPSLRITASPLAFFAVPAAVVPRTSGGASLKFECWAFWYSLVVVYWVRACVSRPMAARVAPVTAPTLAPVAAPPLPPTIPPTTAPRMPPLTAPPRWATRRKPASRVPGQPLQEFEILSWSFLLFPQEFPIALRVWHKCPAHDGIAALKIVERDFELASSEVSIKQPEQDAADRDRPCPRRYLPPPQTFHAEGDKAFNIHLRECRDNFRQASTVRINRRGTFTITVPKPNQLKLVLLLIGRSVGGLHLRSFEMIDPSI